MAYVIGPDGKIIDDGKAIGAEPVNLTSGDMTPEMIDMVLGYTSGGANTLPKGVAPPSTQDPYAFHPAILNSNSFAGVGDTIAAIANAPGSQKSPASSSRSKKISYSESGPNGVVPGNSDPYNVPTGTGNERLRDARAGLADAAAMGETSLDMEQQAGEQDADIAKRQYAEQGLLAQQQQDMMNASVAERKTRREARLAASAQAKEQAVKRITDWNTEAEAAANTEVDPNRYWNNRSSFSKISFALGALAGGMAGKTGADNDSLSMLQTAIGRDINAQSDKMQRKMQFLQDKRGNIDLLNNLDRLSIEDMDQDTMDWIKEFDVKLSATDKEIDKITAKYGAERVNPDLLRLKAKILQGKADIRTALLNKDYEAAEKKIDREFQQSEAAKNRAHDSAMADRRRKWELEDREAAAQAAITEAQASGWIETGTVGGFTEVDGHRDNKIKINPTLGPADITDFVAKAQAGKQEYIALNSLKDLMHDRSWTEKWIKGGATNAALQDAVSQMVYARSGKAATEEERNAITAIITGSSGSLDEKLRGGFDSAINAAIDNNIARGQDLYTMYSVPGSGAIYDPTDTYRSPGSKDTGADLNSLVAQWSGETGTPNKAHGDSSAKKRKSDALDYDAATNAIDMAAEKGDVASIESAIDQLSAIDEAEMAGEDARHPLEVKYTKQRRILEYANAKLNKIKGKGGETKPDLYRTDTHDETMNDYYQGSYSGYDL